jgi:peptide/nickel transport system substrate-binding protein
LPISENSRQSREQTAGATSGTIDDDQRGEILAEASRLVMADYGEIPLHFEMTTWGFRQGLDYKPRADQYTLATKVVRAK